MAGVEVNRVNRFDAFEPIKGQGCSIFDAAGGGGYSGSSGTGPQGGDTSHISTSITPTITFGNSAPSNTLPSLGNMSQVTQIALIVGAIVFTAILVKGRKRGK